MQGFIFVRIVGFLKNSYIVNTAFMEIFVFVCIYRIYFYTNISKILLSDFYSFTNVVYIRIFSAFTCKNENFFHSGIGNYLHFLLDFLKGKFLAFYVVIAVKTAVNTVILTVICNIDWREDIDRIAKMIFSDLFSLSSHFF